jgi:hypothetical protein
MKNFCENEFIELKRSTSDLKESCGEKFGEKFGENYPEHYPENYPEDYC